MNSLKIIKKDKFSKLNFNLKNEIFLYLKFLQIFQLIGKINKVFSFAINRIKIISFIKINLQNILNDFKDFTIKNIELIKNKYLQEFNFSKGHSDEIIIYLLITYWRNRKFFYLRKDKELYKYQEFLFYSKNMIMVQLLIQINMKKN